MCETGNSMLTDPVSVATERAVDFDRQPPPNDLSLGGIIQLGSLPISDALKNQLEVSVHSFPTGNTDKTGSD